MIMANKMKWYDYVTGALVSVGAINWGLVGLFDFNLVETIFGSLSMWVYGAVGIAGIYSLVFFIKQAIK